MSAEMPLARTANAERLNRVFPGSMEALMSRKPQIETMVHMYETEAHHVVTLCPHCAAMGDHGHGGLRNVVSMTATAGACAGHMHNGIEGSGLYTAIDQEKARFVWTKTRGRSFNPADVCSGINRGLVDGIGQEVLKAGGDL